MIVNIPTHAEFQEQGMTLLNLAWDMIMELQLDLQYAEEFQNEEDIDDDSHRQAEKYRAASQKPLAVTTALPQQGTEFLVKAAIAEVSPFLLVSGSVQSWPKGCDSNDTSFSEFRTVDAGDLVRMHDADTRVRISDEFKEQFSKMRQVRNTVFHSVDPGLRFNEREMILAILTGELCSAKAPDSPRLNRI